MLVYTTSLPEPDKLYEIPKRSRELIDRYSDHDDLPIHFHFNSILENGSTQIMKKSTTEGVGGVGARFSALALPGACPSCSQAAGTSGFDNARLADARRPPKNGFTFDKQFHILHRQVPYSNVSTDHGIRIIDLR